MFKELLKILKKPSLLIQSLDDSKLILKISQRMYLMAIGSLLYGRKPEEDIQKLDEEINNRQKDIKKKVLEYLVLEPNMDVHTALTLINIVTNIERLGDYSKNIHQLSLFPGVAWKKQYMDFAEKLNSRVERLYDDAVQAYLNADKKKALNIISSYSDISSYCNGLIEELASASQTDSNLVVITLYIRYMKRVSSHLMHIAQSVDNPFESIGFHEGRDDE